MRSLVLTSTLLLLALGSLIFFSDDSLSLKSSQTNQITTQKTTAATNTDSEASTPKKSVPDRPQYKSQADWDAMQSKGVLRIIVPHHFQYNEFLPRKTISFNQEVNLIIRFAEAHNLTPLIITEKKFSKMLPLLLQGSGDIVAANLTITQSRKEQVNFTYPILHSIEQLVVAKTFTEKLSIEKLSGIKIGVRPNTSFWDTITEIKESSLKDRQEDIQLIALDDTITTDEKFNEIISGKIDAAIIDSNRLIQVLEYRNDIKAALDLGKERPIAWAVRKSNPELLKQLNRFIKKEKLLEHLPDTRLGDLDSIKKHRQLRLITRNNASTYFLWKSQLMGFEYDLIKKFAEQQKVNLVVMVANNFEQMIEWLVAGNGDIISSGLIKTPQRSQLPIEYTEPYLFVQEVIVQRKDEKAIASTKELHERTFYVRKSSSYWSTLYKLQNRLSSEGIHFSIETVPETMETEAIIKQVLDGKFDLTLADSHIIAIEKSWHSNIQASLPLTGEHGHRWLLRKNDKKLLSELNKFIKKEYKQLFYNISFNKYFKNSRKLFDINSREFNDNKVSDYDHLIKSFAREYDFDWRLIAAQINKESQFNPKAKSWAGAKGLMQVMPKTARSVGISNLEKPENGIRAGLKYMAWINDQLSDELPADVQVWFTLAAYNAGLGHLKDARILAANQGLNPDRWFGNVEQAFLLLSKPEYSKKARYGYVRGIEPVTYVKRIQALYKLYSNKYPDEA